MAEKDTIFSAKIKQVGLANFKDFYSFAYDWLVGEGYDITEKKYSEKVGGDSKDIDIEWDAVRKISDYFKFVMNITWQILGLKDAEVVKDNKKIITNKASFEIKVKGILNKDYENKWEDHPFWKFLRGVYDRYIIRTRVTEYENKLFRECDEFLSQCKAFLAIEGKRT
mgnify:CR=1 FL=1